MKKIMAVSTVALAVAFAHGAQAQSAAAAAPPAQDGPMLEDIIVTAQKRSERLQDVPVAVAAVSGARLENFGVDSVQKLSVAAPSLNFTRSVTAAIVTLRGIGTVNTSVGDESIVPIYVDGIYQPSAQASVFDLTSVERVEVLKGPQGTLFGRNAVAGAMNIVTLDPSQDPAMKLSATYGRYNSLIGDAYANVPLSSTLAANVALRRSHMGGYINNLGFNGSTEDLGGSDNSVIRGKLLWTPTEDLKVRLIVAHSTATDTSFVAVHPLDGSTPARAINRNVLIVSGYNFAGDVPVNYSNRQTSVGMDAEWRLGFATLTGVLSTTGSHGSFLTDSDGTPVAAGQNSIIYDQRSYNGELRLASVNDGPVQWLAGFFYFDNRSGYDPSINVTATGAVTTQQPVLTSHALAGFGEVTYDLTDKLRLIGGLRYSWERIGFDQTRNGVPLGGARDSFSAWTPRATVQYRFNRDVQIYATYSQAFKSGVFSGSSTTPPFVPVKPEKLKAYEAGLKADFWNRVRMNAAIFYYDYRNKQLTSIVPPSNTSVLRNAAKVEDYGGELELNVAATRDWNVMAGIAYSHARFDSYPNAIVNLPNATNSGNVQRVIDATGNPLPRAPDFILSLATDYTVRFGEDQSVQFAANYYHASNYYYDVGKILSQGQTNIVNGTITYRPNNMLSVALIGENLTNSHQYIYKSNATTNLGTQMRPRWYGVRFSVSI